MTSSESSHTDVAADETAPGPTSDSGSALETSVLGLRLMSDPKGYTPKQEPGYVLPPATQNRLGLFFQWFLRQLRPGDELVVHDHDPHALAEALGVAEPTSYLFLQQIEQAGYIGRESGKKPKKRYLWLRLPGLSRLVASADPVLLKLRESYMAMATSTEQVDAVLAQGQDSGGAEDQEAEEGPIVAYSERLHAAAADIATAAQEYAAVIGQNLALRAENDKLSRALTYMSGELDKEREARKFEREAHESFRESLGRLLAPPASET